MNCKNPTDQCPDLTGKHVQYVYPNGHGSGVVEQMVPRGALVPFRIICARDGLPQNPNRQAIYGKNIKAVSDNYHRAVIRDDALGVLRIVTVQRIVA